MSHIEDELKSVEDVKEWLEGHKGLRWIAKSSLHLRAFYWGLFAGLGLNETEKTKRESIPVRMWADTMWVRPADDPFRLTELYTQIEALRAQLHTRLEARHRASSRGDNQTERDVEQDEGGEPIATLLTPVLQCVKRRDQEWTYHRERIHRELEQAVIASTDEALKVLESLEPSFRILTVGDRIPQE